jgi:DNA invertase Pin-like site-specific DNA recombinase
MLNILLSFAQFERETTAERTAAKMRARAQRGLWNGGFIPLGYDYDPRSQLLTPSPDEAGIVRRIFENVIALGSVARVCDGLTAAGLMTKPRTVGTRNGGSRMVGGRRFRPDGIRSILRNPIYLGRIRCQGETYPGKHEPIVSRDVWERANAVIAARSPRGSTSSPRDEHVHLLKGVIRCEDCGSTMTPYPSGKTGKGGERYLYYVCTAVSHNQTGCPCQVRRLPARRFEQAVLRLLSELAASPAAVRESMRRCANADARKLRTLKARRVEYAATAGRLDGALRRLVACFEQEGPVPIYVGEEIRRLDARREDLRAEIAQMDERIVELRGRVEDEATLLDRLSVFRESLDTLGLEDQKALLQAIVGGIVVNLWTPEGQNIGSPERALKARIRTRRLMVNIDLKVATPESPSPARVREGGVNQTQRGSYKNRTGSARRSRIRTSAIVEAWGDLDSSWRATEFRLHYGSPPESPPGLITLSSREGPPQESPVERALRLQAMLESGEVQSRAALARLLGVSRAAVTKALRRLPEKVS